MSYRVESRPGATLELSPDSCLGTNARLHPECCLITPGAGTLSLVTLKPQISSYLQLSLSFYIHHRYRYPVFHVFACLPCPRTNRVFPCLLDLVVRTSLLKGVPLHVYISPHSPPLLLFLFFTQQSVVALYLSSPNISQIIMMVF